MRYLLFILLCLFLLQGCDSATDPPQKEVLASPELLAPSDDSSDIMAAPVLTWKPVSGATHYLVQVSKRSDFAVVEDSATVNVTSFQTEELEESTTYYWHVRAIKKDATSEWSVTYSYSSGGINTRIAVGTKLHFENVDMETQEADTIRMQIAQQGMTMGGKTNVMRVTVTVEGMSNDIYMNYEPNGNFSVQDNDEWIELPYGTKQTQDLGLDTTKVDDEEITVEHRVTTYDGAATVIIEGVSYPFEMVTTQLETMLFDVTTGELKDITTNRIIFSFSPKLGFLTGFEEYRVSASGSSFDKTSLYKIEH